jgi:PIN domain nuclease of toxin-antitoxin system
MEALDAHRISALDVCSAQRDRDLHRLVHAAMAKMRFLEITLLELATLANKGRIRLDISLEYFLEEVEARFVVLPISGRACARAAGFLATYPQDPADRIIGATALVEELSLLTADREIHRSRTVQTIW